MISHDHNFKNIFLDFPKESLSWLLPEAMKHLGPVQSFEFIRQEPKKRKLKDGYLSLDMPILFRFKEAAVVLWLVEFQEKKQKFSIHQLLRYTTDMMESHPNARVVPTVLFTRREKWKKDVARELESRLGDRVFLHFEYQLVRLFDYQARDHYNVSNPVVKILLPKMNYRPEERSRVIREAWVGLYQLTSLAMFDKYVDFIDTYVDISEDEREALLREITEQEDTVMLAQHIKEKGIQEGVIMGRQEGVIMGRQEGVIMGRQEGIRAMVVNASRQGLPEDMIARIAGLDVTSVKKILNNEKVKIPLDKLGL
ncbi:hypothetical protein [Desulfobotulus mexicanus]|uniref:Rpn family recombination-promoting nuclease/putative transposase n=1 Tax=Desulfobotulus mexicanus TaxID=2586642 RepID=A0A5S5MFL2_9BACT|nr:hypothetical protein [Desulfobotulus mexicanus]TYT74494.1 hypothetical protein FIM25_10095 [Desulfobotulus mexicanus]